MSSYFVLDRKRFGALFDYTLHIALLLINPDQSQRTKANERGQVYSLLTLTSTGVSSQP